ncbi:class I SAM-dependent methyltransferase [Amnibacterium sp.]|uniref:class I SAM-dependent methyltransferase n=1 Tax=Amnibacterium sp. TaxID=1872496 RepID=UPI003F7C7FE8
MVDRALSFGAAAAAYERFRPEYPDEVVERVLRWSGRPIRTALEIGAGTGKATRAFVARGVAVTAVEPDAAMLGVLRSRVPAARALQARFEDVAPAARYDLVFAAASLHWTDPGRRWDRVAALLPPGGVFASFGGPMWLADPQVERAVQEARAAVLGSDDVPAAYRTSDDAPMQWPGTELEAAPAFTDVEQHVVHRRSTLSVADWVGHLSTLSAYLTLAPRERTEVLARIAAVLPEQVEAIGDVVLHLARRT